MTGGTKRLKLFQRLSLLLSNKDGNFAITTALIIPLLLVAAGGAVDVSHMLSEKTNLQELLDSGILAAARMTDPDSQRAEVESFLDVLTTDGSGLTASDISSHLTLTDNADGSLTGVFQKEFQPSFLGIIGLGRTNISVSSTALTSTAAAPCIYVLANKNQALLVNSGANVVSQKCEVDVSSTSNPAFIMNSGATIDTAKFCVKGTQYINNGGKLTNFHSGCTTAADPYANTIPEPAVPSSCASSGAMSANSYTLQPGVQCGTIFNGSPTLTFAPGLHIIKGTMIINANATIIAQGVTFYFPDTNSRILINGGVTMTASAPTSGPYKGVLMFEKTSDASNNANKQQFIFNGSKDETLQGIIYLPNRDVTYNSTTNSASNISMVVNTMIMNSSNWKIEPYTGGSSDSPTASGGTRLIR